MGSVTPNGSQSYTTGCTGVPHFQTNTFGSMEASKMGDHETCGFHIQESPASHIKSSDFEVVANLEVPHFRKPYFYMGITMPELEVSGWSLSRLTKKRPQESQSTKRLPGTSVKIMAMNCSDCRNWGSLIT